MNSILRICAVIGACLSLLHAQDAPKAPVQGGATVRTMTSDEMFQWFDANSDGVVSREEILAKPLTKTASSTANLKMADNLMKKDADSDGKISKKEWTAAGDKAAEGRFATFDANSDGTITKEEFLANPAFKNLPDKAESFFKGYDKNGDARITKEEWMAAAKAKPAAPAK